MTRHPWLARWAPALEAMIQAADLPEGLGDGESVWVVPAWMWVTAPAAMGRKGYDRVSGGRLGVPVRVQWDAGGTVSPRSGDRRGRAVGPGIDQPVQAAGAETTAGAVRVAGEEARWSLFSEVEVWAAGQVERAAAARRREIAEAHGHADVDTGPPPLDEVALEGITSDLMVAPGGAWERMCRLMVRPGCFERTDPLRWLRMTLAREADQAVGRALGDVWTGPRLRRLAAAHPHLSVEGVAERFNAGHVRQVTAGQVRRALEAGRARRVALNHDLAEGIDALAVSPSAEDVALGLGGGRAWE
ncbi:hypothetical protein GZ998_05410 [Actinomyces sp. 594]|uniref:hypothetical protein n=1 Tax=Actinomyces sp. 594 TaxID=2057793 RepID=UPI001C56AA12|nr:hypothetical protein [Actinomyces sp. 594]MBW3068950.1 hypothetical protein [Actinomyces sp. 594]